MQIQLNGKPYEVTNPSLADLVEQLQLGGRRYAIEINEELIPRGEQAEHSLREGDRVEIVQAIGGG
jgi:sulfur carrier protein